MEISARNGLKGKVEKVTLGTVMANVHIKVEEPGVITAAITRESAEKLGLKEGDDVTAIIKATEVIVGKEL
ncbi:MAG: TOBE domain-containing protein [Methanobrevibacter wolinii]|nr:TOBE domain-containing protein [Methanobrevibacter wolinii]